MTHNLFNMVFPHKEFKQPLKKDSSTFSPPLRHSESIINSPCAPPISAAYAKWTMKEQQAPSLPASEETWRHFVRHVCASVRPDSDKGSVVHEKLASNRIISVVSKFIFLCCLLAFWVVTISGWHSVSGCETCNYLTNYLLMQEFFGC